MKEGVCGLRLINLDEINWIFFEYLRWVDHIE